jgi:hypothetical protein
MAGDSFTPVLVKIGDADDPSLTLDIDASGTLLERNSAAILIALQAIDTNTDNLESLATALNGFVDGIEGFVDGLETNTAGIATLAGAVGTDGSAAPAGVNVVAGKDGSGNAQALLVDAAGKLLVTSGSASVQQTTGRTVLVDLAGAPAVGGTPQRASTATVTAALRRVLVACAKPLKITVQKRNAGVDTVFGTLAAPGDDVITVYSTQFTLAGVPYNLELPEGMFTATGERFEVVCVNADNSGLSDAYVTIDYQ